MKTIAAQSSIFDTCFSRAVVNLNPDEESVAEVIERAGADDEWDAAALSLVKMLCESRESFDLDDVATLVPPNKEPRAMGRIMKRAVKDGWCRRSGVRNSKRKSRHYGYIAVYESLIFPSLV